MTRTRSFVAWCVLACALLLAPTSAWAHTKLKRSDPGPKSMLSAPPQYIRLWFTEQPELTFTKMSLADAKGASVPLGEIMRGEEGSLTAKAQIYAVLPAGVYTVSWSTVAVDGHPAKGEYTFRVLAADESVDSVWAAQAAAATAARTKAAAPQAAAESGTTQDVDLSAVSPVLVLARLISLSAVLLIIGAVAFRVLVLARVKELDAATRAHLSARMASRATRAAAAFVLVALVRIVLEQQMIAGTATVDTSHMRTLAMTTTWGISWAFGMVAGIAALLGFLLARRLPFPGWTLAALASLALAVTSALGGHAAAVHDMTSLSVADDALHVLSVSAWMGGLFWLSVVALPFLRGSVELRAKHVAALVTAFSPPALVFAGLVVVTGTASAWLRLGALRPLYRSAYGQVLLVKLFFFLFVLALGFANWRRARRASTTERATSRVEETARTELVFGALVLVATAVLVGMPLPAG